MPLTNLPNLSSLHGAAVYFQESQNVGFVAVSDDQEEVALDLAAGNKSVETTYYQLDEASSNTPSGPEKLKEQLRKASENIVVTSTLEEYAR